MSEIAVYKDNEKEGPIPTEWRSTLKNVADAIVQRASLEGDKNISVAPIPTDICEINKSNIEVYPDELGPLQEQTWKTSIYIWMGDRWQILLDLSTIKGEVSDLVLHGEMFEQGSGYLFAPGLIYVP